MKKDDNSQNVTPFPAPAVKEKKKERLAWFDKETKQWSWRWGNPNDLSWTRGTLAGVALALCQSYCAEDPDEQIVPPIAGDDGLWVYDDGLWRLVKHRTISARLDSWDGVKVVRYPRKGDSDNSMKMLSVNSSLSNASKRSHTVSPEMWNRSAEWFDSIEPCVAIGNEAVWVDLNEKKIIREPLRPEHGARFRYPAEALASNKADRWSDYLNGLFGGDNEMICYFEAWCGLSLLGLATHLQLPALILCGDPGTGKSTLANVIKKLFPSASVVSVPPQLWTEIRVGGGLEQLQHARLNVVTDLDLVRPISEHATLKRVIFGESVSARPIYKESFNFAPRTAHLWCANGFPSIPGADRAVWDRFVPFPVSGPNWRGTKHEQIDLDDQLFTLELKGILERLLSEAGQVLERLRSKSSQRMVIPAASLQMKSEWQDQADNVIMWLTERTEFAESFSESISPKQAWIDYKEWSEQGKYHCCTQKTWRNRVKEYLGLNTWAKSRGIQRINNRKFVKA